MSLLDNTIPSHLQNRGLTLISDNNQQTNGSELFMLPLGNQNDSDTNNGNHKVANRPPTFMRPLKRPKPSWLESEENDGTDQKTNGSSIESRPSWPIKDPGTSGDNGQKPTTSATFILRPVVRPPWQDWRTGTGFGDKGNGTFSWQLRGGPKSQPQTNADTNKSRDGNQRTPTDNQDRNLPLENRLLWSKNGQQGNGFSNLARRIFKTTRKLFTGDAYSQVFPPKHRRNIIEDITSSFKDDGLKTLFEKMLPKTYYSEGSQEGLEDTGFNFTALPGCHVRKLVREIGRLPQSFQDKITGIKSLTDMTIDEITQRFPVNVFPAFTNKKFEELKNMTSDQTNALCKRLLRVSCAPWNLRAAIDGGINCLDTILDLQHTKRFLSRSQVQILMDHLQLGNISDPSDSTALASLFAHVGSAMTPAYIMSFFPTDSLSNITATRLPYKSQRRALLNKMKNDFGSPTAWPDTLLEKMSGLVDDMDMYEISLLRKDYIEKAEKSLRLGMKSIGKRLVIAKYMGFSADNWKNSMDLESIKRGFPWLKSDRNYLEHINLTNLLEVLNTSRAITNNMLPGEVSFLAARLAHDSVFPNISDITGDEVDSLGNLLDGFGISFFNKLSDEAFINSKAISRLNFTSKAKSRAIMKRLRNLQRNSTGLSHVGSLFRGISFDEIEALDSGELINTLSKTDKLGVDEAVARKIIRKIRNDSKSVRQNSNGCSLFPIDGLEELIRHIPAWMIIDDQLFDPNQILSEHWYKDCNRENKLTKSQYYALFETIKKTFGAIESDKSIYNADFFDNIGNLVLGMTANDIEKLANDTDLLTILEILAQYEDEMDSSQVEAIAKKIRVYFDIDNRKKLEEVNEISVSQVGRFLQYLDVKMELPKYPKHLRMHIAKEIGRSRMNKISASKQNELLRFALKNMVTAEGNFEDLTKATSLDEKAIQDLGYLRCGMMTAEIKKLTSKAIEDNIEDLQLCPFKLPEAKRLVKRTLDLNTNMLKRRELLVGLGALLPYVSEEEMNKIDNKEIAAVSEYIIQLIEKREKELEIREHNGFIREWTSADKENSINGKNNLLTKISNALKPVASSDIEDNCHRLRSLGDSLCNVYPAVGYSNQDTKAPCIDELGNLPCWRKTAAREVLKLTAKSFRNDMDLEEMVQTMTSEQIMQNAGFIKGLTASEIRALNLSTTDVIAAVGEFKGYSIEQLRAGFEIWKDLTSTSKLSTDDIVALKNFVCGMSPDLLRSMIGSNEVRETADVIGSLTTCSHEQLEVLAAKLTDEDGFGSKAQQWKIYEIAAVGHIVGGLSADQLSSLTSDQLHAIAPETITKLPVEKVKDFTANQLASLTTNQKNAITSMQRSYLTDDQTSAIEHAPYTSGGESKLSSKLFGAKSFVFMIFIYFWIY